MKKRSKCEEVPRLSPHLLEEINGRIKELKQLQKSKEEQARELLVIQATKRNRTKAAKEIREKTQYS